MLEQLIEIFTEIFLQSNIKLRISKRLSNSLILKLAYIKGSALNSILFILSVDVLSEEQQTEDLIELYFADDLVIVSKIEEELQSEP